MYYININTVKEIGKYNKFYLFSQAHFVLLKNLILHLVLSPRFFYFVTHSFIFTFMLYLHCWFCVTHALSVIFGFISNVSYVQSRDLDICLVLSQRLVLCDSAIWFTFGVITKISFV